MRQPWVVETQGTCDWEWTPGGVGLYTFKHTTITDGLAGEELTAQFYVPGTMTDATVSLAFTECLYDGSAACPKVVVTQGGKTLVEGLDYTVSYALNDKPGTGVVVVRGARGARPTRRPLKFVPLVVVRLMSNRAFARRRRPSSR